MGRLTFASGIGPFEADPEWRQADADYFAACERGQSPTERKRLRLDASQRMYEIELRYERAALEPVDALWAACWGCC